MIDDQNFNNTITAFSFAPLFVSWALIIYLYQAIDIATIKKFVPSILLQLKIWEHNEKWNCNNVMLWVTLLLIQKLPCKHSNTLSIVCSSSAFALYTVETAEQTLYYSQTPFRQTSSPWIPTYSQSNKHSSGKRTQLQIQKHCCWLSCINQNAARVPSQTWGRLS
jgi:hypothetical protein